MRKDNNTITKRRELIMNDLDLKRRKWAAKVMDEIRKRHKIKSGEKNSVSIIRYFRNNRYKE